MVGIGQNYSTAVQDEHPNLSRGLDVYASNLGRLRSMIELATDHADNLIGGEPRPPKGPAQDKPTANGNVHVLGDLNVEFDALISTLAHEQGRISRALSA